VAFVLTGIITTLLGPMLPFLSARWTLNDAQSGHLFTVQFLASLFGVALSTFFTRRNKYRFALMLGLALMGLGAALLAHSDWLLGIIAISTYGVGLGLTIPAANLLIGELNPSSRAAALNLLNFSWGIGAVGSPFAIQVLKDSLGLYLFLVAALLGLSALSMLWVPVPQRSHPTKNRDSDLTVVWWSRFVLILGILFFAYVGTENAVGGWIASYAKRIDLNGGHFWAMMPSFFWGALLSGRALAPWLLRRIHETRLATIGLALAAVGIFVLLIADSSIAIALTAMVTGLGLSSLYPAFIAMLSHWFGEAGIRVGGVMFSLASLGGAVVPWLVGALSTQFGSLRVGLLLPLFSALLMLVLYVAYGSYRPATGRLTQAASN